jgi:4-hydroxybenzoate polyprenyltransferase
MPQAVLGVAFSFGIPMAFAAVQAQVPWQAGALLLANLFWVLAYDTEYAMVDRDDDLQIGMKTSAITLGRWDVLAVMAFYLLHLLGWAWVAHLIAPDLIAARGYQLGLLAAFSQIIWHFSLIRSRTREGCFKAFRLNHWVGFSLFAGIAVSLAQP